MPTLVVVDMQRRFAAANDPDVIRNVCGLVKAATSTHQPITILEYGSRPPALIMGYRRCKILRKYQNDGSPEVFATCLKNGFDTGNFIVCGVNARACVKATVMGLLKIFPQARIEIPTRACNCMITKPKSPSFFDWANEFENVALCA
jgi:nicotinamidase-related amidase